MIANLLRKSVQLVPWKFRQRIKYWPLVAPAQRWMIDRFLGHGSFLHTINAGPAKGLRIGIELPEDKALWTGTYEAAFSTALSGAVRKGDVCYDVGAYRGFFAGVCALAGASAVQIFEPLPANISRIQSLMEANPNLPLDLHPLALGAEVGEQEFTVMPEASMGKLSGSDFQPHAASRETLRVPIETLDHLREAGKIPPPDIIKIDVEGAEAMVLRGAQRLLSQCKPQLFIEIHSRPLAGKCSELLRALGYRIQVLETSQPPDFSSEPEICHFVAMASGSLVL
jgi:FkbM family methyltransferase